MTKIEICRKITGLNQPHQKTIIYSVVDEEDEGIRYGTSVKCIETDTEAVARRLTDNADRIDAAVDYLADRSLSGRSIRRGTSRISRRWSAGGASRN